VARWTAGAKWGEAPAPDGQRDTPLALSLSEWLGRSHGAQMYELGVGTGLFREKLEFACKLKRIFLAEFDCVPLGARVLFVRWADSKEQLAAICE
jgi:hypothetical protein